MCGTDIMFVNSGGWLDFLCVYVGVFVWEEWTGGGVSGYRYWWLVGWCMCLCVCVCVFVIVCMCLCG